MEALVVSEARMRSMFKPTPAEKGVEVWLLELAADSKQRATYLRGGEVGARTCDAAGGAGQDSHTVGDVEGMDDGGQLGAVEGGQASHDHSVGSTGSAGPVGVHARYRDAWPE